MDTTSEVGKRLRIQVNGDSREAEEGVSLVELISELKLKPEQIAIELNHEVIRRAHWEATVLREGDKVEIVHFVGGGCGGAGGRGRRQEQEAEAGAGAVGRRQGAERVLSVPSAVADG